MVNLDRMRVLRQQPQLLIPRNNHHKIQQQLLKQPLTVQQDVEAQLQLALGHVPGAGREHRGALHEAAGIAPLLELEGGRRRSVLEAPAGGAALSLNFVGPAEMALPTEVPRSCRPGSSSDQLFSEVKTVGNGVVIAAGVDPVRWTPHE